MARTRTRTTTSRASTSLGGVPHHHYYYESSQRQTMLLQKPIVILPELNHLYISLGITPIPTHRSGGCDGSSSLTLEQAHAKLGQVVVDFMHVHCTTTTTTATNKATTMPQDNNNKTKEHEQRLLQLVESTQTYLQPFLKLTDPVSTSRFVQDCQSKLLLPLPSASAASSSRIITVLDEWRYNPKDFLYFKPKFSPRENVLQYVFQWWNKTTCVSKFVTWPKFPKRLPSSLNRKTPFKWRWRGRLLAEVSIPIPISSNIKKV
jgi:hypothetical protein